MSRPFLELLQPYPPKSPPCLDAASFPEIISLASGHNLTMLVYSRLKKYRKEHGSNGYIDGFLEKNRELRLASTAISVRQEAVQNEIFSLLTNNGIPSAVIKGNTLAADVYDDPNSRSSDDIDILIRTEMSKFPPGYLFAAFQKDLHTLKANLYFIRFYVSQ